MKPRHAHLTPNDPLPTNVTRTKTVIKKENKPSRRFLKGYLIYVIAFLVIGAAFLIFLWSALASYEKNENEKDAREAAEAVESERIWKASEEYRKLTEEDADSQNPVNQTKKLFENGYAAAVAKSEFVRSEYETDDGISRHLASLYPLGEITYESSNSGDSTSVSVVYDKTRLFEFDYIRDGKNEYGNYIWKLDKAEFLRVADVSLKVTAPEGAVVKVGDRVLTDEDNMTLEVSSEYAAYTKYCEIPKSLVYTLTELCYIPDVTVTLDDKLLDGTIDSENNMVFSYPETDVTSLSEDVKSAVKKGAEAYNMFVAGDAEFDSLKSVYIEGTETYKSLALLDNNWYMTHSKLEIADFTIVSAVYSGDSILKCRVNYNEILYNWGTVRKNTPVDATLVMIYINKKWLVASIKFN